MTRFCVDCKYCDPYGSDTDEWQCKFEAEYDLVSGSKSYPTCKKMRTAGNQVCGPYGFAFEEKEDGKTPVHPMGDNA